MRPKKPKSQGSLERHQKIQDNLESRLRGYGYKVYTNIEYYNHAGRTLGEIDVLAIKTSVEGYMQRVTVFEVKSGKAGFLCASHQVRKSMNYLGVNGNISRICGAYVTEDDYGNLKVKRIR